MTIRKLISPTGEHVDAEVIEIEQITDRPILIKLSDGSTLRIRVDVIEVCRALDKEGNPMYNVNSSNFVSIVEFPEHLRKKTSE